MTTELTLAEPFWGPGEGTDVSLGELVGAGATASVHVLGGDPALVVKTAHPKMNDVLLNEAVALTLARGPGVPRLRGVLRAHGRVQLLMARARGQALNVLLKAQPPGESWRKDMATAVLSSVGAALVRLHALGWAHRDVKPENIMVDVDEPRTVALVDFGLANDALYVHSGTPLYLPEQVLRGHPVDAMRADCYALCRTVAGIFDARWHQASSFSDPLQRIPDDFRQLLQPVLLAEGAPIPNCEWLLGRAFELNLLPDPAQDEPGLAQKYIATRLSELLLVHGNYDVQVSGLPGAWLSQVLMVLAAVSMVRDTPSPLSFLQTPRIVNDLSPNDRRRFLAQVIGPLAAGWEMPPCKDSELLDALTGLARGGTLRGITFRQLSEQLSRPEQGARSQDLGAKTELDACTLAFELSERPPSTATLLKIARLKEAPESLLVQASKTARLTGELGLCSQFVARLDGDVALWEQALLLARQGARPSAEVLLDALSQGSTSSPFRSRALVQKARFAFDRGDVIAARGLLEQADGSGARAEVEALIALSSADWPTTEQAIERGLGCAEHAEQKARLLAVRGMLEHGRGDPLVALDNFARAVDYARGVGAALEEATYLTGLAASASDAGQLGQALDASERAEQLFEALGRPEQTARALLARAAALGLVGAKNEVGSVVARGMMLARRTGDTRCEAFLLVCQCDVTTEPELRAELARGAQALLGADAPLADRLSVLVRLLPTDPGATPRGDAWVSECDRSDVCWEWWGARAQLLLDVASPETEQAALVISALEKLAQADSASLCLGPALVSGAQLALRVGRAELARTFLEQSSAVADRLLRHVRAEHRASVRGLLWVEQAQGSRLETAHREGQLSDVEGLLKALGRRQGFRALLDQVLDMLLLWTGVERGMLLLRAPEGRLVVRAARNLNRTDISEEQRTLSLSVAQRAMQEGRPVLLLDAGTTQGSLHRSVVSLDLRSVLAVPLASRGEILGIAYLDDRVKRAAFGQKELSWASLIATVAALAICDERDRLALRRALRRAKRAEARLASRLNENEAELELAQRELNRYRESRKLRDGHEHIIGKSRGMRDLLTLVDRVAESDVPAMILGESGTGKELIARAIASSGTRRGKAFIAENCAAVPEPLLESTLFGHKKGAFTGATRNQPGLFSLAHGGTLFLDEIGEMSLVMQTKLLRVLQDGEVRPLGSERSERVDVRLLVATHRDLEAMVAAGQFRQDLYFRLNVIKLKVPPLRERREDIPLLVAHFLARYASSPRALSNTALARLCSFDWPGNVRQLENEVRRMIVLGGEHLTAADLSPELLAASSEDSPVARTLREKLDALERKLVLEALEQAGGNRTRAADALGVSRFGLQKMTLRLNIDVDSAFSGRIRAHRLDERT